MQKSFRIIILLSVAGLIVFSSGFLIGKNISSKNYQTSLKTAKSQLINDFEQKLTLRMKKGLIFWGSSKTFATGLEEGESDATANYSVTGEIKNIDLKNDAISVKVENKYENGGLFAYLDEPDFYVKTVKADNLTKIIKRERKNNESRLDEEQWEKVKIDGEIMLIPIPSSSFTETEISIQDLRIGSKATIETELAFSPKDNEETKAKKIVVDF